MLLQRISLLFITSLLLLSNSLYAATIKGYVYDSKNGEQLVGALVVLENTKHGAASELDGRFIIKNVPAGSYKLKISYASYNDVVRDISLTDNQTLNLGNIKLTLKFSTLKEVQVTGKYKNGSDEQAQSREKNGKEIMNVLSAHSIQLLPDITVASVVQRISGVSIDVAPSGHEYVVIRGMDKKYNTTLVNGVKIPSPNDKDRYVPMDLFPAELLERLEVIKTLSPSMEGDAGGGVVNLVMKSAPDTLMFDANIAAGESLIFQNRDFLKYDASGISKKSPAEVLGTGIYAKPSDFPYQNLITNPLSQPVNSSYGFTAGNRFLKNKLGVIVSGSYQNTFEGYNSQSYLESPTVAPSKDKNTPLQQHFSDLNIREFSTLSQRLGLMSGVDYKLNNKNSISLFATYIQLDDYRTRYTIDSGLGGYHLPNGYTGYVSLHHEWETRSTLQSIYNVTLQGKHEFTDALSGDWSLVASEAKQQIPDRAVFHYSQAIDYNQATGIMTPRDPFVASMSRDWMRNTDKDIAAYLNLHYIPHFLPRMRIFDIGGLYRHKERLNYSNSYGLEPVNDSASVKENYVSIPASKFTFIPQNGALGTINDPGDYTYTENIVDFYAQADYFINDKLNLFGGLRVENTMGGYVSALPVYIPGKTANYVYSDYLPSLQAKYRINDKSALRASYFRSIYRPAYGDLVPYPNPTIYEEFDFIGNDSLQHTTIDNYDIRYEIFPKGLDEFMIGAFYKSITDPIEYVLSKTTFTSEAISPLNSGHANNYGFEIIFRKYFGNFGVSGNYTFTQSLISTPKEIFYLDSNGSSKFDSREQTRPLQNQAKSIGNISLLYKDTKRGIDAQLAFTYTGERIHLVSQLYGLDQWQKPTLSLDFSAEKRFGKHFAAYLKIKNLLNNGVQYFIKQHNDTYSGDFKLRFQESPDYITVEKDQYYTSFLIGLRYKL
jgi:hypothetical protein